MKDDTGPDVDHGVIAHETSAWAAYRPHAHSLPAKVIEFFFRNRDEELTTSDIAAKFLDGRSRPGLTWHLSFAVRAGYLSCVPGRSGPGGNSKFSAGPRIGEWA